MNHAHIAAEALRLRRRTLSTDPHGYDVERAADVAVACGDPVIDGAIRRIGALWTRAGLDPARIADPWQEREVDALRAVGGWALIDALDDIVRGVARQTVAG